MALFGRSQKDTSAEQAGIVYHDTAAGAPFGRRVYNVSKKVGKKVVDYDGTEANRIGVPYVSSADWLRGIFAHPGRKTVEYFDSLFPFTKWILSYNSQWALGDLIAGVTVGLVVVPQSLSYATLATVAPEYGLYSSFVGVVIYALFATSKDVTIGPVAVMSLQTANVIREVVSHVGNNKYTHEQIASALAFICGVVTIGLGLFRLGWIVEFIPAPAVSGFMTGSAITIIVGQVPKLMGISGVNTNGPACYHIIIDTLKRLPHTKVDAAFGLGSLAVLYLIRWVCNYIPRRRPRWARAMFFISVLRSAVVIIVLTAIVYGWLKTLPNKTPKKPKFPISIIGPVPAGFKHVGQPLLTRDIFADMAGSLPASVIVLLLEHIAISKSFGRVNNYKINPNQELVAIGVTNLVGPTFGAYAATGSFSRSAIKAKSGVRTPLAGWITAVVVVVALYAVAGAFYWIPNAVLSAVIIHAVGDLIAPPSLLYKFWLVSPFEFFIWVAAVLATIFASVEIGVYVAVAASAALLLIRIARPRGQWLGRVRIFYGSSKGGPQQAVATRDVFVPLDDKDGMRDPSVHVERPPAGVLIYRFEEAFTYPNANYLTDNILDRVKQETRPKNPMVYARFGDRPWNEPGSANPSLVWALKKITGGRAGRKLETKVEQDRLYQQGQTQDTRDTLRAIIFDCSSVSNVDTTSVQSLADVRRAVERYVGDRVEFHFVSITSPWIRRALLAAGFGTGQAASHVTEVAAVVGNYDQIHQPLSDFQKQELQRTHDIESGTLPTVNRQGKASSNGNDDVIDSASSDDVDDSQKNSAANSVQFAADAKKLDDEYDPTAGAGGNSVVSVPVIWNHDLTPFFHLDISTALTAATGRPDW